MNRLRYVLFLTLVFSHTLAKGQSCKCDDEVLFYVGIVKQNGDSIEPISIEFILKDSADVLQILKKIISDGNFNDIDSSNVFLVGSVWSKSYYAISSDSCYKSLREKEYAYEDLIKKWTGGFQNITAHDYYFSNNTIYMQIFVAEIIGRIKKRQVDKIPHADIVHIKTIKPYEILPAIQNQK